MKRFLFAAVAAVMVASCATDEVKEYKRDELNFYTSVENTTRAESVTSETLSTFKVWGFHEGVTMMNNLTVTKQADGSWSYGDKYFWPATGTVDFYALAAGEVGSHTLDNKITATAPKFTFGGNLATTGAPSDYSMPAAGCILPATMPDMLYATAIDEERQQTDVVMNFRHAISQVEFAVKNNSTLGLEITFGNYIAIKGVKYSGTYSLPTTKATSEDFEDAASHGSWSLDAVTADHVLKQQLTSAVAGSASDMGLRITGIKIINGDNLDTENIVLPQKGTVKVVVPAVIKQNGIVLFNDDMEFDLIVDWKEGYRYIYTLVLNDDTDLLWAIDFTATVDNIRNGGTDDIRVPDGTKLN
jgi:hypothetical protein